MSRGTPHVSVRVAPELADAVRAAAQRRGETLTAVVLRALSAYVATDSTGRPTTDGGEGRPVCNECHAEDAVDGQHCASCAKLHAYWASLDAARAELRDLVGAERADRIVEAEADERRNAAYDEILADLRAGRQ